MSYPKFLGGLMSYQVSTNQEVYEFSVMLDLLLKIDDALSNFPRDDVQVENKMPTLDKHIFNMFVQKS